MSCAAAATSRLERPGRCTAAAHPLEQADRRGRGEVEALRPPRVGHAHAPVGGPEDRRRATRAPRSRTRTPARPGSRASKRSSSPCMSIATIVNPRSRRVAIASSVDTSRTTGTWKIEPADARTLLGLYASTELPANTTPSGPRRIGRPQDRARVAGVPHLVQHGHRAGGSRASRVTSTNGAIPTTPCGVTVDVSRSMTRSVTWSTVTPACSARTASGSRSSCDEQRQEASVLGERLRHRLRALDQEPTVRFAQRPLLQPDGGGDLRVPGRRQHDDTRTPRTGGVYAGPDGPRLRAGGSRRLRGLDELRERTRDRGPRGPRGSCGRPRRRRRAARCTKREYERPWGRTAALMRVIQRRRNCALRSRRSR